MKLPDCEVCGTPVANGKGYVCVDQAYAMYAYPKLHKEWKQARIDDGSIKRFGGMESWTGTALVGDSPEAAKWHIYHEKCDPSPDRYSDYWFGVERCRTYAELINWTAHLMDKNWLVNTDWSTFLQRVRQANIKKKVSA